MQTTGKTALALAVLASALLFSSLAGAVALVAPGVTTQPANSIDNKSARLNGSVNPNGQATTWYFEFGPTTSYGTRTNTRSAGSGTRTVSVSQALSGLAASTTYHFRLVASNASGTTLGADVTFTTQGPPVAETGAAQSVAPTTVTLTGSVDPRGRTTTWRFDYGTSTSYGSRTPNQATAAGMGAVGVSAAVSGLTPNTTYHYRILASNGVGTVAGADATFATPPAVTLTQGDYRVVAGNFVRLSGTVTGAGAGVTVAVMAQQFGAPSYTQLTTVLTGGNGSWSYNAQPQIQTSYQASANGGTSTSGTVGVQPAVSLARITRARFLTRVTAAGSFAGKQVKFQRESGGRWVTVSQKRLNAASAAIFPATLLPHGTSTIRVAISVNQAGPGYLGGISRTLTYRRA
jgi:hypothetical protein